ncbi:MAG: hypothetical protein JWO67_1957 [Streptosporangiaceae bacterium]|nr:hypothetical protein [Streptosporangiaceae bacterium]
MSTTIEWTEETWNFVTGCTRISDGCDNCYIERTPPFRMAHRRFDGKGPGSSTSLQLHPERLTQPYRWQKPRKVFVNSLSDLFLAKVPVGFITEAWKVMADTPRHTYQILTKRPERLARVLGKVHAELGLTEPLPNVWLGTSIESDDYTRRADALRQAPAAVRFISAEPLLGPLPSLRLDDIDWLILGGESGPGSRPLELDWIRDIVGQCRETSTAPFVKQLGTVWAKTNGASDKKGGNPADWPADLRVREYPTTA